MIFIFKNLPGIYRSKFFSVILRYGPVNVRMKMTFDPKKSATFPILRSNLAIFNLLISIF